MHYLFYNKCILFISTLDIRQFRYLLNQKIYHSSADLAEMHVLSARQSARVQWSSVMAAVSSRMCGALQSCLVYNGAGDAVIARGLE